jgi:hypothetical protein
MDCTGQRSLQSTYEGDGLAECPLWARHTCLWSRRAAESMEAAAGLYAAVLHNELVGITFGLRRIRDALPSSASSL